MSVQKNSIFLLFFCFGWFNQVFSQITATTTSVSECAPANITFSAPAGATSISWSFGSFGSYNTPSGSFNVLTPSSFNAIFSGIVSGNPVTFTVPVVVHAVPVANFVLSQPSNGCAPVTVTLTDNSTFTSPLQTWQWVYGDGNLNTFTTGIAHTYTYSTLGGWNITMVVTDVNGCDAQKTLGPVNVTSPPIASISSNPPVLTGCSSIFNAIFSATNSVGSGLTYNWNFGNSQTSNLATTSSITFTSQATPYPVSLTVTANGCSAVANTYVTVSPPSLQFTVPLTVCLGASATATINTNQPYTTWYLDNSTTHYLPSPAPGSSLMAMPVFTTTGVHAFTVTAGVSPCITSPIIHTVNVEQVVASFNSSSLPLIGCNPLVATYQNLSSTNATQFLWTYQNYLQTTTYSATVANPTFTFTQGSANPYTVFYSVYHPTVSLQVTSAAGCSDTYTQTIHTVRRPTAWFNKSIQQGCAPLAVTLSDSSYVFAPDPISTYTWCDGSSIPLYVTGTNSNIPSQLFNYSTIGTYSPYLIIQTVNGCIDTSYIDKVIVSSPPTISFGISSTNLCPNQSLQITNTSPNLALIEHWHIESDNGYFSGCVSDPNPTWKFTNTGTHTIALSGYEKGCKGTSLLSQNIIVKGPIVKCRYETNCSNRKSVTFYSDLQEVQTATLNFGDNSNLVIAGNATGFLSHTSAPHTYTASGDYTVTLTGINLATGCPSSNYTMVVRVRDVSLVLTGPAIGCSGGSNLFNATASTDAFVGCAGGYVWYIDNLPPKTTDQAFYVYSFTNIGIHTVSLTAKDLNGCTASTVHSIRISSVSPIFSTNTNTVCLSTGTIQITNTSSQVPDPITNYFWNFGNGQTYSSSQLTVPIVTYTAANVPFTIYSIALTASNSVGCTQSITKSVSVLRPPVLLNATPSNVCLIGTDPSTVTILSGNSNVSYTLDYGVDATSTLITTSGSTTYSYNAAGVYSVTMQVKNAAGCENSGTILVNVVNTPTANFSFNSPGSTGGNNICSGNIVTFTNVSSLQPYNPTWNLGSGTLANTNNVVSSFYASATNSAIAVSMTVNTGAPAFCKSSVTNNFTIFASDASISLSKTVVCLGESIQLNVVNANGVSAWIWDYGDATPSGTIYTNSVPAPGTSTTHIYSNYTATAAGNTNVSLIYWSIGEACKVATDPIPIKIIFNNPDFNRNNESLLIDTIHCINVLDKFNNLSTSNSSGINYVWSFPDGSTKDSINPTFLFANSGVNQVTLSMNDVNQCKVQTTKNVTINPLPLVTILDGFHCPNVPFQLNAYGNAGVVSGTWSPVSGILGASVFTTTSETYSVSAIAAASSDFSISVTDLNGCISKPSFTNILIQQPPVLRDWDTTVIVGEPIPMNGYVGNFTYTWSPVINDLNCTECFNATSHSTVSIVYRLLVEDSLHCSITSSDYSVNVLPKSSVDVPTAFTPNGDNINDVIFVGGWGIKKLNYFKVFNRYGQLIFESNDLMVGWNGEFRGIPQNMETYVYQVSVDTFVDKEPLLKSGTFKLIR